MATALLTVLLLLWIASCAFVIVSFGYLRRRGTAIPRWFKVLAWIVGGMMFGLMVSSTRWSRPDLADEDGMTAGPVTPDGHRLSTEAEQCLVYDAHDHRPIAVLTALILVTGWVVLSLGLRSDASIGLIAFSLVWVAAGLWILYGFLFRFPHHLQVDGHTLSWKGPLLSGVADLSDLRSIRPYQWAGASVMIRLRGGRRLIVMLSSESVSFFGSIQQGVPPGVEIDLGRRDRYTGGA